MQNFENLTLCLSVGDATAMNILESKVLTKVIARTNKMFFNGSNSGCAKTKGLKSINALKNIVKNLKINGAKKCCNAQKYKKCCSATKMYKNVAVQHRQKIIKNKCKKSLH